MRFTLKTIAAMVAMCSASALQAQVKLCPLFTDNMVMQQMTEKAPLWGETKPGKKVTVTTSWDGANYTAQADAEGKWSVLLKTGEAGGPYTITINDGKKVVLNNVMLGEVWLCSGQSNMGFSMRGVQNAKEEIAAATNKNIRLLQVKHTLSPVLQTEFEAEGGGWLECSPETVPGFSAVGYFFAKNIQESQKTPVGVIDGSWGGTIIETWISLSGLATMPEQARNIEYVKHVPMDLDARKAQYEKEYADWHALVRKMDGGYDDAGRAVWAAPDFDDSAWGTVTYRRGETTEPYEVMGFDGFIWERRTLDIPAHWAGKEITLNIGGVDDNDVTYFNGVEVGSMDGVIFRRSYTVPGNLVKAGKNVVTVRIQDTGGFGGFYPGDDNFRLELNGTKETVDLAGEWHFKASVSTMEAPVMPVNTATEPNVHSFLYNSMINPLVPYTIKGAIWYQGESNSDQAYQYRDLMPLLIQDWRNKWGYDFPFFQVQLANYKQRNSEPEESTWAELREAQHLTAQHLGGTGMACIIDIGEANDIHPTNKQDVGYRLGLAARSVAYGERVVSEGPTYRNFYRIEGGKIRLMLSSARGLHTSDGGPVKGFAIAGLDRKWHWANATIVDERGVIEVSSPEVPFPVAVRYGWANNPDCNLYNDSELPAVPFRTDDWPGLSFGNRR